MRICENCGNKIPDNMKLCPHCGTLPPRMSPMFTMYVMLTVVSVVCTVYFRPFGNPPLAGAVSSGTLWAAFIIFICFFFVFAFVSLALAGAYAGRENREKLTDAEIMDFVAMKKHIEAGEHTYDGEDWCTVCGHKK